MVALLLVVAVCGFLPIGRGSKTAFNAYRRQYGELSFRLCSGKRSPGILSSNLQDVESWLKGNFDFKILIPHAAFAGYDLVGGDILDKGAESCLSKVPGGGQNQLVI